MSVSSQVVTVFLRSCSDRSHWTPVPSELRPHTTIEDGYRIQKAIHEAMEQSGEKLIGYKVGAISKTSQREFGITEPVYAGMFSNNQAHDLATALSTPLISPSVECEIALRLKSSIDGSNPHLTKQDLIDAIDTCHITCEIVDNRYSEPHTIGAYVAGR